MKIEQKLYEEIKHYPKERKKEIMKVLTKIQKLETKIILKNKTVSFDKRYNKLGVFSDSNLAMDELKQKLVDLKQELLKLKEKK